MKVFQLRQSWEQLGYRGGLQVASGYAESPEGIVASDGLRNHIELVSQVLVSSQVETFAFPAAQICRDVLHSFAINVVERQAEPPDAAGDDAFHQHTQLVCSDASLAQVQKFKSRARQAFRNGPGEQLTDAQGRVARSGAGGSGSNGAAVCCVWLSARLLASK